MKTGEKFLMYLSQRQANFSITAIALGLKTLRQFYSKMLSGERVHKHNNVKIEKSVLPKAELLFVPRKICTKLNLNQI